MKWKPIEFVKEINYKKNGGQLIDVETSEEQSIIPEGALHKNKHHLDLEHITKKGVPVVTINGDADTIEEIQHASETIVQHAEVEKEEIIFSKELTDFIEAKRKEWHQTNSNEILEEVGKRVTKEILFNTDDRTDLIQEMKS